MAKKAETWYISKKDQNFTGEPLVRGQLCKPTGAPNDRVIFGDNTRWVYRFDGSPGEIIECGTDGCGAMFIDEDALRIHRLKVHAAERDAKIQSRIARTQDMHRMEEEGETIGGFPVKKVVSGPGGDVPYIDAR